MHKCYFVTGGAGFIGSAVIRYLIENTDARVINIDKLTYAGNLGTLVSVSNSPRYVFEQVDICDSVQIKSLFAKYRPDAVMHLAAESHVDRSIDSPSAFIQTNIVGTYTLLEQALSYWKTLQNPDRADFRFLHISTDEVFGSLEDDGLFTENTPYMPSSPYSASKAASDHLVRAWVKTYGFPALITNCSNNYGPYQYPEKLIPLMILNAIEGAPLPVYGNGNNVRDWLYVEDHAQALVKVVEEGRIGETYNIGGNNERTNLQVVQDICTILDELLPDSPYSPFSDLITFVDDRPGHDLRYAIDANKIKSELKWVPEETFSTGLRKTVQWYLENTEWCDSVSGNAHKDRLGLRGTA